MRTGWLPALTQPTSSRLGEGPSAAAFPRASQCVRHADCAAAYYFRRSLMLNPTMMMAAAASATSTTITGSTVNGSNLFTR